MMDLFPQALDYLLDIPPLQDWPQMQEIAKVVVGNKPRNCRLPAVTCEAVCNTPVYAVPGMAAIVCLQTAIVIIDDMLDDDPKGLYHEIGSSSAANLASAFQATGLEAIIRSKASPEIKMMLLENLNSMVKTTALGQCWDVQNPTTEEMYWAVVRTKSSPFFQSTFYTGALLGGAEPDTADVIGHLGFLYGEMIQLHDAVNDALAVPADPDWLTGRQSLPLLYAEEVDHEDRTRFKELRPKVTDPEVLEEAQTILIRSGAISYVIHQLLERHDKAQLMLDSLNLPRKDKLEELFEEIIEPVNYLLESV